MLTLGINFTHRQPGTNDIWTSVADSERLTSDDKSCQQFFLQDGSQTPHVFYTHEELLEVQNSIVRVLNRIGPEGEEFNEDMEHTKDCARRIRELMQQGYKAEFVYYELKPQTMGKVAFNIRSDCLF